MKKKRQSNIELLRITSMLLVLIVHANFKVLGAPNNDNISIDLFGSIMRYLTESLSIVCVNAFVLISGWFGINANFKRLAAFLFQIISISLFVSLFLPFHHETNQSWIIQWLSSLINGEYWFVYSYLALYLFTPILNAFVEKASKRQFEIFLLMFYLMHTLFGFVINISWINMGYSPVSFMGLYLLARYMHIYPNIFSISSKYHDLFIWTVLTVILTTLSIVSTVVLGNSYAWRWYWYSSPIVILEAVCLFSFFSKLSFYNKFVNCIAASCFSVYLVHAYEPFMEFVFKPTIRDFYHSESVCNFVLMTAIFIASIFIGAILLDKIRIFIWQRIEYSILNF